MKAVKGQEWQNSNRTNVGGAVHADDRRSASARLFWKILFLLTVRHTQEDEILVILRQNVKLVSWLLNVKMGAKLSHSLYFKCCLINITPFPSTYSREIYNQSFMNSLWQLDEDNCPPSVAIYKEANKDCPSPRQFDRYPIPKNSL